MFNKADLEKLHANLWEIPKSFRPDMRVPARLYASEDMLDGLLQDRSLHQLVNVATMPGIQSYSLVMPDAHEGYGFPIGGVAAFDPDEGVISPGGIGYDINCGVRLLRSELDYREIQSRLEELGTELYRSIPSGVGKHGPVSMRIKDLEKVLRGGAQRMVEIGYGEEEDLKHQESHGKLPGAEPDMVSDYAKQRGKSQLGTMGAGNHFVEVNIVDQIFDEATAIKYQLAKDRVVVLIHTGSRGFGHQVATDYIREMVQAMSKYHITLPDRELACVPFHSDEGQRYFGAMTCAANFAFANRQLITQEIRDVWHGIFGHTVGHLDMIYDVCHNVAKLETYTIDGESKKVLVHRKGATRSFPGQPVLIPGSMGTGSYMLLGQEQSLKESFGSCCHGAGRCMSRRKARKSVEGHALLQQLNSQGIVVNSGSLRGLAEDWGRIRFL